MKRQLKEQNQIIKFENDSELTLFWEALISTCLLRWANFNVLCVSSLLLEAGVTVQISYNKVQREEETNIWFGMRSCHA